MMAALQQSFGIEVHFECTSQKRLVILFEVASLLHQDYDVVMVLCITGYTMFKGSSAVQWAEQRGKPLLRSLDEQICTGSQVCQHRCHLQNFPP